MGMRSHPGLSSKLNQLLRKEDFSAAQSLNTLLDTPQKPTISALIRAYDVELSGKASLNYVADHIPIHNPAQNLRKLAAKIHFSLDVERILIVSVNGDSCSSITGYFN